MPPKKKGKKAKGGGLIDGVDTSSMTREQLEAFALRLKNEMEREREERNFFQLERDKLRTFWDITRNQLEEARATIRNKDRDVEVAQETAEIDVKHVVQQMKHLQYENLTKIGEIRAEGMTQLQLAQEDHGVQEEELLRDKRELRRQLREKEEIMQLQIQELKIQHSEMMSKERDRFEKEAEFITTKQEKKMEEFTKQTNIKHRMELFEVEERKNVQTSKLIEAHDQAFNEMKNYYNDITLNNLSLINSLKDQMEELRRQSERNERLVNETKAENKKLVEPFKENQIKLAEMKKKMEYFERDRAELARLKTKHAATVKELNSFKWEAEALSMRADTLIKERDEIKSKFEEAVFELQQRNGLRNVLLERKINIMEEEAEQREAMLSEALSVAHTEPSKAGISIDCLLQMKNEKINDLNYELSKALRANHEMLEFFEEKALQLGISRDQLGLHPFKKKCKKTPRSFPI